MAMSRLLVCACALACRYRTRMARMAHMADPDPDRPLACRTRCFVWPGETPWIFETSQYTSGTGKTQRTEYLASEPAAPPYLSSLSGTHITSPIRGHGLTVQRSAFGDVWVLGLSTGLDGGVEGFIWNASNAERCAASVDYCLLPLSTRWNLSSAGRVHNINKSSWADAEPGQIRPEKALRARLPVETLTFHRDRSRIPSHTHTHTHNGPTHDEAMDPGQQAEWHAGAVRPGCHLQAADYHAARAGGRPGGEWQRAQRGRNHVNSRPSTARCTPSRTTLASVVSFRAPLRMTASTSRPFT